MQHAPAITAQNVGVRYDLRLTPNRTIHRAARDRLRAFGRAPKTDFWALEDVSFEIEAGDILGVVGANGSGKSTLLLAVAGVFAPDRGSLWAAGRPTLLTLSTAFERELSGRENIYLNAAYHGFSRKEIEDRVPDIIAFSELGDFIDVPIRKYSAGMRTRLSFAVASHLEPDVLLLDEILGVGDQSFRAKSRDKMRAMMEDAKAIVVVTHNVGFVKQVCTKALWLENGRVAGFGEPREVVRDYVHSAKTPRAAVRVASSSWAPKPTGLPATTS